MTAPHIVDPERLLGEALSQASPDLMRSLLQTVINSLLSAEADAVCGAEYGQASPERRVQRNGYRHRDLDTRVGTIDVAVPRLRTGSYFPDWLLERRKRAESALIDGGRRRLPGRVSTRRMDKLIVLWASARCRSHRSHVWRPSSTSTSPPSATVPWATPAPSSSWRPTP